MLLDLSAMFDIINHNIILNRLENYVGSDACSNLDHHQILDGCSVNSSSSVRNLPTEQRHVQKTSI